MSLTDTKVRSLKPREKKYKVSDGKGLFLLIAPQGSKYWRFKYTFNGKERLLAFGVYPDLSLSEAREKCHEAQNLLAKEIDPGVAKKVAKRSKILAAQNTFEAIAREWYAKFSARWVPSHGERILKRLEKDVFP